MRPLAIHLTCVFLEYIGFLNIILLIVLILCVAMLKKGLIQIYTGDGKGKTTAALGLALRAAGQGNNVLIYQFLKPESLNTGEYNALHQIDLPIEIMSLDVEWDMATSFDKPDDVKSAKIAIVQALQKITEFGKNRTFDVIILDEINFCFSKGLAGIDDIKSLIKAKDEHVELILTGRGADERLTGIADLVTEMKSIKHPFAKGTGARKGIEY